MYFVSGQLPKWKAIAEVGHWYWKIQKQIEMHLPLPFIIYECEEHNPKTRNTKKLKIEMHLLTIADLCEGNRFKGY